jgi:hypothetical protein
MVVSFKDYTINDIYSILNKIILNNTIDTYKIKFNSINALYAAYKGLNYTIENIIKNNEKNYEINCNELTNINKIFNINKDNNYIINISIYIDYDNSILNIISDKIIKFM